MLQCTGRKIAAKKYFHPDATGCYSWYSFTIAPTVHQCLLVGFAAKSGCS
jgi:hypothetical protein